jgi:hypothetical protein
MRREKIRNGMSVVVTEDEMLNYSLRKQNHERRYSRINSVNWRTEYWVGEAEKCLKTSL